jgi:hypothetical protein
MSLMNNGFLTLATALLLFLGERPSVVGLATCSAFGFLAKPTFMLAAIPYALLALRPAAGPRGAWVRPAAAFLLVFALLTSPC